jgi:uncharacterized protein with HEPN domain
MPRSSQAYPADIVESCEVIELALSGIDTESYLANRVIRSAVEREFMIIGEAVASLGRTIRESSVPALAYTSRLERDERKRIAHEYAAIDDEAVLRIAQHDVPILLDECRVLLAGMP